MELKPVVSKNLSREIELNVHEVLAERKHVRKNRVLMEFSLKQKEQKGEKLMPRPENVALRYTEQMILLQERWTQQSKKDNFP